MSNEQREEPKLTEVRDTSRRSLLGIGATGAMALLASGKIGEAQPSSGGGTVTAGAPRLIEREITYKSGDTDMRAFWVEPAVRPKAALIVVHEIWGLNVHIRDVARRFAAQGYIVLAPDLYTREGAPNLDVNNREALMAFLDSLSDTKIVADLQAAVEYLQAQGAAKVGSVGFCMGGLYSYLLACKSEQLSAAVDFYGRIVYAQTTPNKPESPLDLAPQLKCPLLCHFGETDASIPLADIEKLKEKLKQSSQPWKINVYPGAGHAFFNETRPSYNAGAAADAGEETLNFFRKHLIEN